MKLNTPTLLAALCVAASPALTAQSIVPSIPSSISSVPLSWDSPSGGIINKCDFCLAAQGISPLEAGGSGVRADVRYLRLGTLYHDGVRDNNDEQEIETHLTQQYSIYYAVTPKLTLSALVPLARRTMEMTEESGEHVTGETFGLGDAILLGRFKVLEEHDLETTTLLSVNAGVKLPTGATDALDSRGELLDAHIQLGTGSVDLLAGTSLSIARDRFTLSANLLGALAGQGAHEHRFGNNLNYDLTLRYRVYPEEIDGQVLMAGLGLYGEWRASETEDGEVVEDSGGNTTYLGPSLQFQVSQRVVLEAAYHHPILHALHGRQLGEDYRVMAGVQVGL